MSERPKPHNGRDTDGRYRVRAADVDDLMTDPDGIDYVEDDVRLGGAVEDIGARAGMLARRVQILIDNNRLDVDHLLGRDGDDRSARGRSNGRGGRVQRGYRGR